MPISFTNHGVLQAAARSAIPYPTAERAAAVDAVAMYLRLLQNWGETRYALAGNGSGIVTVPDRATHIYCRIGGVGGTLAEARIINLLSPQDDDPILIRRESPGRPGGWLVIDWKGTGEVPLTPCGDIPVSLLLFALYFDGSLYRTDTLAAAGGSATSLPEWKADFTTGRLGFYIGVGNDNKVTLNAEADDGTFELFASDNGVGWAQTKSIADSAGSSVRFDRNVRELGFVGSWGNLSAADQTTLKLDFHVADGAYALAAAEAWILQFGDVLPIRLHVSQDGGDSWSDIPLQYFGATHNVVAADFADLNTLGFTPAADYAALCPVNPGTIIEARSVTDFGYAVCGDIDGADLDDLTFLQPDLGVTIAPLQDGQNCYVCVPARIVDSLDGSSGLLNYIYRYTNLFYKVNKSGAIAGMFEIDPLTYSIAGDNFRLIETDPTDTNFVYSTLASNNIARLDFAGQSVELLTPGWDLVNETPGEIVITQVGTLLVAASQLDGSLIVYRSVDKGASWTTIDLTAMGAAASSKFAFSGSALSLLLSDGSVAFSIDDGVTFAQSAVILYTGASVADVSA